MAVKQTTAMLVQQNPKLINWWCQLIQVDLHNSSKTGVYMHMHKKGELMNAQL